MKPYAMLAESTNQTSKTLYLITGVYVVIGFLLAIFSANNGDRMGTFLGFVIISGALGAAVLLRSVLRMGLYISQVTESLEQVRAGIERMEKAGANIAAANGETGQVRTLDLANIGRGDPTILTAATLDRSVFPRLVAAMEDQPPARGEDALTAPETLPASSTIDEQSVDGATGRDPSVDVQAEPATRNLLRQWKVAVRNADLVTCRSVLSALVDTASEDELQPLRAQLEALADRAEGPLHDAFSRRVREHDYAGALAIGERIVCLLPDRRIAEEFKRIEPHLVRRIESIDETQGDRRSVAH
ncbi:MAG: hypothetical protein IID35_05045 [Planctomycetes bacterium]|nr:hypothetical protein [Planctomycetota bacterium]